MPNTEEQCLDIIENCTLLLEGPLKPFNQTDNTLEGRMITQCQWRKKRAENHDLPLPIKKGKRGSFRTLSTESRVMNGPILQMQVTSIATLKTTLPASSAMG